MAITPTSSATNVQNLQAAQSSAQLDVLKKANDMQADQVKELLQAQAQDQAQAVKQQQVQQVAPGQPGSQINVYA